MEKLYLIIIAFVLGILIYTILPKFCGCKNVIEGHEPHSDPDHYEKIYHLLNTLPWHNDETELVQSIQDASYQDWTNNICNTSDSPSIYKYIDSGCEEERLECAGVDHSSEYPRLLMCQLEKYSDNVVLKNEFKFNLDNINIDEVLTVDDNVIKFAKVAHRLIKKHEYIHGLQWHTDEGAECIHGEDGCAWVDGLHSGRRTGAGFWNKLKLGILNGLSLYDPNSGVKVYSGYRGSNAISKVSLMHTNTALGL